MSLQSSQVPCGEIHGNLMQQERAQALAVTGFLSCVCVCVCVWVVLLNIQVVVLEVCCLMFHPEIWGNDLF